MWQNILLFLGDGFGVSHVKTIYKISIIQFKCTTHGILVKNKLHKLENILFSCGVIFSVTHKWTWFCKVLPACQSSTYMMTEESRFEASADFQKKSVLSYTI